MTKYDEAPEAAEADLRQASADLNKLEDELAILEERLEQVEREADAAHAANNPQDEAEAVQRHTDIEREIEALRQDISSADTYLASTTEYWFED